MVLQLCCQAPGSWHPTITGGRYILDRPSDWIGRLTPYLRYLGAALKYTNPIVGPWLGDSATSVVEMFKHNLELMNQLCESLPGLKESSFGQPRSEAEETATGAALRVLQGLLDERDPIRHWGGLRRTLSPEGHYLWLCDYHAAEYA